MKKILIIIQILFNYTVMAQIGINTTGARPDASAMLDVTASNKGILIPRMTTAQKLAIVNPKEGLLVYDIDAKQFSYCLTPFTGATINCNWVNFGNNTTTSSGNAWSVLGNAGTDTTTQYIGTSDNKSLFFRINNKPYGRFGTNGNIAIGRSTLIKAFMDDGYGNIQNTTNAIAIGDSALSNLFYSYKYFGVEPSSIAIGTRALQKNIYNNNNNIAIGYEAQMKQEGAFNTAIGYQALRNNIGSANLAFGNFALFNNTTGSYNIGVGYNSLKNNNGSYNVAIGNNANNGSASTSNLVSMGYNANAGTNGVAIGAASAATTNATAIGYNAMAQAMGAVAIGDEALLNNTAAGNVGIGSKALKTSVNGEANTVVGFQAGTALGNSSHNTFIGYAAGGALQTGSGNTFLGNATGATLLSGQNNIFVGNKVGYNITQGDSNIVIGSHLGDYLSKYVKIGRDGYKYGFGIPDNEVPAQTLVVGGGVKIKGKEAGYDSYIAANTTGNSVSTWIRSGGMLGEVNIGDMLCAGVNIGVHPNVTTSIGGQNQITVGGTYYNVGINNSNPQATLSVIKRPNEISNDGALAVKGTTYMSHFAYSAAEDTYIRGGKDGSKVIINDGNLGNVGIGTNNPTTKLDVRGQVRIVDGSQANSKVLTSDADGNASWQAPAPMPSVSCRGLTVGPNIIPSGDFFGGYPLDFYKLAWSSTEHQQAGAYYDQQANNFYIPSDGVYLINAKVGLRAGFNNGGYLNFGIFKNNANVAEVRLFDGRSQSNLITSQVQTVRFFHTGDRIDFRVAQYSFDGLAIELLSMPNTREAYCSITKLSN
jgi:hypothetical protein